MFASSLRCRRSLQRLFRHSYSTNPSRSQIHAPQRNVIGVFSPVSAALFVAVGTGLVFYFRHEKTRHIAEQEEKARQERMTSSYGRPQVGGPFSLTSATTGKPFTQNDLLGQWSFVYFGFTNCPDICPAELDKVTAVVDAVRSTHPQNPIRPVFITVDPVRDTEDQISLYLKDFHPDFVGLRGDYQETKSVCRAYRVYFSTPPNADPKGDYLVDHSIFIYLMDPKGQFVEAFGQATTVDDMTTKVREFMDQYKV